MRRLQAIMALAGLCVLSACAEPEAVGRSDTSDFYYSLPPDDFAMSAMMEERDMTSALAAVSMKNALGAPEPLYFSDKAQQILAQYGK